MSRIVLVAASVLAALGAAPIVVAGSVADAAGGKAPPKKGPAVARYILTVNFSGYVRFEVQSTTGVPIDFAEDETAWAGRSKPFTLVNRGSRAKPSIEIRTASLGPRVAIDGFLQHRGSGENYDIIAGKLCTTTYTATNGDSRLSALVTLTANRLQVRMEAGGSVLQRWTQCSGREDRVLKCPGCLSTPERLGLSSAWWSKSPIDRKLIKFGRTFTISRWRNSLVDGDPVPPLVGYSFKWVLKFSPVKS